MRLIHKWASTGESPPYQAQVPLQAVPRVPHVVDCERRAAVLDAHVVIGSGGRRSGDRRQPLYADWARSSPSDIRASTASAVRSR
jgi:hypothetical protein